MYENWPKLTLALEPEIQSVALLTSVGSDLQVQLTIN